MYRKKNKKNKGSVSKEKKNPLKGIKKDKGTCYHYGKDSYWRRNCMEYLTTMKGKKLIMVSTSNMFMIKNYLYTSHYSS
jgi:hypothetical protein